MNGRSDISAQQVAIVALTGNILLTTVKALVGFWAGSSALLVEAVHSAGDIVASSVILVSVHFSSRPPDQRHQYGHGKIETLAILFVAVLLLLVGYEVVSGTLDDLREGTVNMPGVPALWVSAICMAAKEGMFRYTVKMGRRLNSSVLIADAWHHRSDALVLTGVFVGVGVARLGYPVFDTLTGLVISVLIIRMGIGLAWRGFSDLIDTAPHNRIIEEIYETVLSHQGVKEIHKLRARQQGSRIFLELKIGVDANLTVAKGHDIAKQVKLSLNKRFPQLKDIIIHVNPTFIKKTFANNFEAPSV